MRTFDLEIGIDIRAVVPDSFTKEMREISHPDHASTTKFLQQAASMHPIDDEEFTLFVLMHGIRRNVRAELAVFLQQAGIGGTLSPAVVQTQVRPVLASKVDAALSGTLPLEQLG